MNDQELASLLRNAYGWRWYGFAGQLMSPDSQQIAWPREAARLEGLDPDRADRESEPT